MAALTSMIPTVAGTTAAPIAASAGGDSIPGDGYTRLLAYNPTGASITVTVEAPGTDNFGIAHATAFDSAVVIPAGTYKLIGPFAANRFNDAGQRVQLTYSAGGLNLWPIA